MKLQGKKLAILAEDLYQDLELWYPLLRMREEGAQVTVVGTEAGATYKSKVGYPVVSDKAAREVRAADYDGVIIPGGYAPDLMRRHEATLTLVRDAFSQGKVVAAICHAGWVLASAGILKGRRVTFAKPRIADLVDTREPQLLAGIVGDLRVVNGQRGRMAIFKLDDGSEYIEAVANEELLEANRERLREDELVIVQGKLQPDRFSGGLRLNVNQVWDLPAARARFGKYLAVAVNGKPPPVADVIRTWPAKRLATDRGELQQGLAIRLQLQREAVEAELDLGDAARFCPSDEALARWKTLAHEGRAAVVYE